MARIRTIKPEFFTSEDIVGLSPLARLLYIALWCESDKEGRLVWKPQTFKLRYFPGDACDIAALCDEVVRSGLVFLYGDGYACIPKFSTHQHINPRESDSKLPAPDASPRVNDSSARDSDAQVGREGKGKEGNVGVAKATLVDGAPPTGDQQPSGSALVDQADAFGAAESRPPPAKVPTCPHADLLKLFANRLPAMPQPRLEVWRESTAADHLRARWRWLFETKRSTGRDAGKVYAATLAEGIDWFDRYFAYVSESDFLTARKGDFKCTLQWLVNKENFGKVLQGNYVNGGAGT
jgi:hypothetical protein